MKFNRVMVTGSSGMVGHDLFYHLASSNSEILGIDIIASDQPNTITVDICDRKSLDRAFVEFRPDVVFHLAALTDVDYCEIHANETENVNIYGTNNIAELCAKYDSTMVYLSTASIFPGDNPDGYSETDVPCPSNIYAKSKLAGEEIIQNLLTNYYVIRAGWMVGGQKKDKKFVGKILAQIANNQVLYVVTDVIGSLTFSVNLRETITQMLERAPFGIYHCINKGVASRFDIAKEIVEILSLQDSVQVVPVDSSHFPLSATRPKYECLIDHKLENVMIGQMPDWKESLRNYLDSFTDWKR